MNPVIIFKGMGFIKRGRGIIQVDRLFNFFFRSSFFIRCLVRRKRRIITTLITIVPRIL